MSSSIYSATVTAPVNIATLKYWGKRDTVLNLPTNSSISITLSQDDLCTTTTASASANFTADHLWLNGIEQEIEGSKRIEACFRELRALRRKLEDEKREAGDKAVLPLSAFKLHIVSENNFPTAAGLASSAAGFAAFVSAIAKLFELPQSPQELSVMARQGSGSACRSLFGGFVAWNMGSKDDGSDSSAECIAPREHWPNMRAAILVASADKKDVSSTSGMQVTVHESSLFKERVKTVVPKRFEEMKAAILAKDFPTFAELTMRDSNQFHAVCLDSYPPIFYMNDVSHAAIRVVEEINKQAQRTIAAYTFDAGPNCVIYYLEENEQEVLGPLKHALGSHNGWAKKEKLAPYVPSGFEKRFLDKLNTGIERVILTSIGDGPQDSSAQLVDHNGEPLR